MGSTNGENSYFKKGHSHTPKKGKGSYKRDKKKKAVKDDD